MRSDSLAATSGIQGEIQASQARGFFNAIDWVCVILFISRRINKSVFVFNLFLKGLRVHKISISHSITITCSPYKLRTQGILYR